MSVFYNSLLKMVVPVFVLFFSNLQSSQARLEIYDYAKNGNGEITPVETLGGRYQSFHSPYPYYQPSLQVRQTWQEGAAGLAKVNQPDYRRGFNDKIDPRASLRAIGDARMRTPGTDPAKPSVSFTTPISPPVDWQCAEMLKALEVEHAAALRDKASVTQKQLDCYSAQLSANHARSGSDQNALKDAYQRSVDACKAEAQRHIAEIDEVYAKKMQAVANSHDSLKEQIESRTGNTKVVQSGSNMYVHNYINFGDSTNNQLTNSPSVQPAVPVSLPKSLMAIPGQLR